MEKKNNNGVLIGLLIGIIIMVLIVVGLFATNTISFNTKETSTTNQEKENKEVENLEGNKNKESTSDLEKIAKNYEFNESAEPNQNMSYKLSFIKENGEYFAILNIDGFQTMKRMKLKVHYENNEYVFQLKEYMDENVGTLYNIEDILFKLYEKNNTIYTKWEKLQPMLEKNKTDGIYFK